MAEKKYEYTVERDQWDSDGNRHRKGRVVKLTADEAQDGVESGALKRIK